MIDQRLDQPTTGAAYLKINIDIVEIANKKEFYGEGEGFQSFIMLDIVSDLHFDPICQSPHT